MADKIYKSIDSVLEKEYKDLSDEAIDKFGKGERLDPKKQKRYDEVKGKISKQVKKQSK